MTQIEQLEECRADYLQVIASFESERKALLDTKEPPPDSPEATKLAANARAIELLRRALARVEDELVKARSSLG